MTPKTSIARAGHSNFLIGGLAALSIIALVLSVLFAVKQSGDANRTSDRLAQQQQAITAQQRATAEIVHAIRTELRCVTRWANATADRSAGIAPLANARIEDLYAAFRAALAGRQAKALRLAHKALREDRAYRRYLRTHPVPQPRLSCRLRLPRTPPPATVTVRPAPSTVHVTATVTGAALRIPGPTVTRTLTATRTVTTTAPPGRHRTKTVTAAVTVTCRPPQCKP